MDNAPLLRMPFGQVIILGYKEHLIPRDTRVYGEIENVLNAVKTLVHQKGVSATCESIFDELLTVRVQLTQYLKHEPALVEKLQQQFTESGVAEAEEIYHTGLTRLSAFCHDALEVYQKVSSGFEPHFPEGLNVSEKQVKNIDQAVSFDTIKQLPLIYPSKDLDHLGHWIEASLKLDYAFITTDLVLDGSLELDNNELKALQALFKDSIEDFGFYSVLLGIWQPEEEDEAYLVRNIKIRLAAHELDEQAQNPFTIDELKSQIES